MLRAATYSTVDTHPVKILMGTMMIQNTVRTAFSTMNFFGSRIKSFTLLTSPNSRSFVLSVIYLSRQPAMTSEWAAPFRA
jgi:hypothetical protein